MPHVRGFSNRPAYTRARQTALVLKPHMGATQGISIEAIAIRRQPYSAGSLRHCKGCPAFLAAARTWSTLVAATSFV